MRVIVADETGLLKSIELEKNEQRVIGNRHQPQGRERAIERICWYQDENQDISARESVVVARASSVVELYRADHAASDELSRERQAEWSFPTSTPASASSRCVGVDMLQRYGSVVHCTAAGDVLVRNSLREAGKPSTFSAGPDLERMRLDPFAQTHIATGGKERDLNVWSLERQEAVFKAKNVTHDKLDMRVPVWVKDLQFLSTPGSSNGHRVVVGTGHHHIRLYDTNTKRRPVLQIEHGEYPINALCVSPDETRVFAADTTGCVDVFDLRTLRHMGRCIGPNGAVRDLACHPTLPFVAAVGLDRFVHVFDVNTRQYHSSIYAKQRLNAVLFCNDGAKAFAATDDGEDGRAHKRRKHTHGDGEDEEDDDEMEDEEEIAYEGLEISDQEEDDDDDDDDDEEEDGEEAFDDEEEDSD
ncbi:hypothetical protein PINS_up010661 [Pythium insidiosum]|nr:hypothetical protein PINS_up010661 [Pythium insidiosum]